VPGLPGAVDVPWQPIDRDSMSTSERWRMLGVGCAGTTHGGSARSGYRRREWLGLLQNVKPGWCRGDLV
jgi:hypothetical protein